MNSHSRSSLRRRIVLSVVSYTVLVSLAITLHGYVVNERAEQSIWESLLEAELTHLLQRRRDQPSSPWQDTEALKLFGVEFGKPIPTEFGSLPPGVHDEIRQGNRQYVVLVRGVDRERIVFAMDISHVEQRELTLTLWMILSAIVVVTLLTVATWFGANYLMRPLTLLSGSIRNLRPDTRGQAVKIAASDPEEVAVIADALNEYLRQIDRYVERERSFLNIASHELRTPIAVISGAAELAAAQKHASDALPHLLRIQWAARDMQHLVSLLLVLAKDPARLNDSNESIDLSLIVPRIVADHAHLVQGKELSFSYGTLAAVRRLLPAPIAYAAIGNLVRNAIENTYRGTIRVSVGENGSVVIEDSGAGMSAEEMSRFHMRRARNGERQGDGIGLDLIARLCEHLGWTLNLQSNPAGGTIATLTFDK